MATNVDWDGSSLRALSKCIRSLQIELEDPIFQANPTVSNLIDQLHDLLQPLSSALIHQHPFRDPASSLPRHHEKKIDGAIPTLRQIEIEAIAAATPITYLPRDLLLLIHEHLLASGLLQTASMLLKEAQLKPLPTLVAPSSLVQQPYSQEAPPIQLQWPSAPVPGFLSKKLNLNAEDKDVESQYETPIILPMKHKLSDLKDIGVSSSSGKRLNVGDLGFHSPICPTPSVIRKSSLQTDATVLYTPSSNLRNQQGPCTADYVDESQRSMPNLGQITPSSLVINDHLPNYPERITLDSLVVQYLQHQHCQCPTPIITLPSLSLLHPHVCAEPKQSLDAPSNVTSRLGTREFKFMYHVHGNRRDRKFVYSQFRPSGTAADVYSLTGITFLGDSPFIAVGNNSGDIQFWDTTSLKHHDDTYHYEECHRDPLTLIQSFISADCQLLLSSSSEDVKLWNVSSFLNDNVWDEYENVIHFFHGCKAARFSHSGNVFAALSSESAPQEIKLYDIETCELESMLLYTSTNFASRGHLYSPIHFSHSDSMLLWNGVLWDRRVSGPVHHFDQLTDFGGGGFHPAGNEVIINSEVWDLRKFRLLRSVPSLDQTTITFNAHGDVIYAILRRNIEDVMSAFHTRRVKHPLFAAFRTVDAVNYSDIATTPVEHCVLDFTTEPTDSFVGLVTIAKHDWYIEYEDSDSDESLLPETWGCVKIYEIGHRSPTNDD
ncbi:hypothetical protein GLYMA_14G131100v4 [Glycine max]|uniref:Uncharacterized protein n=1 Tax=Glycine max TaxID=3847 RepID=K7M6I1_SOYBN|nr:DDB1- and CUL4-associated factor homolog 1 [Glycine max]XP_006596132.1 DDB1- and CUL4-associated factor homolog 1 [Glycine max]KAG4382657.1 hypothetical protein GLYMA_14G131100v4 [Glycine max]KRH16085.1 hypothetical protein GLYMA_14G131100v4 [Glycine max]|eukprot:XP_006596131.1 DDB1- and CUL4-associated factor homolog 1 [Glycine max]